MKFNPLSCKTESSIHFQRCPCPRPEPTRMSIDELTAMHLRNDLSKKQFEDITSTFNASVFESLGINVSTYT